MIEHLDIDKRNPAGYHGWNPKDRDGDTPLNLAVKEGHVEICQLMFKNVGINDMKNNEGLTPLHVAAKNGHFEICENILKNALGNNTRDRTDPNGRTPFQTVKSA